MSLGIVRLDADRLAICRDGFVALALNIERNAEIGKVNRVLRMPSYGWADQVDGGVMAPHLMRNDPQKVQGVGIIGLSQQQLPVPVLGLGQSSRLVVLEAHPQEVGSARWSRGGRSRNKFGRGAAVLSIHECTL
jgi:hypothetical protein